MNNAKALYIKPQSISIQKSMATDTTAKTSAQAAATSFKKAPVAAAVHQWVQTPGSNPGPMLTCNTVAGKQSAFFTQAITAMPNGQQVIQLVPQMIVTPQPVVQYLQLVPIETETTPVLQKSASVPTEIADKTSSHRHHHHHHGHGHHCCSDHKKVDGVTVQSSCGHTSALNTAVSGGSDNSEDCCSVEIEIPGGFDNINSFENSSNVDENSD